jgi:hypothetical protein
MPRSLYSTVFVARRSTTSHATVENGSGERRVSLLVTVARPTGARRPMDWARRVRVLVAMAWYCPQLLAPQLGARAVIKADVQRWLTNTYDRWSRLELLATEPAFRALYFYRLRRAGGDVCTGARGAERGDDVVRRLLGRRRSRRRVDRLHVRSRVAIAPAAGSAGRVLVQRLVSVCRRPLLREVRRANTRGELPE